MEHERLSRLYERIRPVVESLGGSVSKAEFAKMCEEGAAFLRHSRAHTTVQSEINELKRRVSALEQRASEHN
jgi:hypothetical protein